MNTLQASFRHLFEINLPVVVGRAQQTVPLSVIVYKKNIALFGGKP